MKIFKPRAKEVNLLCLKTSEQHLASHKKPTSNSGEGAKEIESRTS